MAKRCEVCKRTYPDKEPTCPYCAEAIDIAVEEESPASSKPPKAAKKPVGGSSPDIALGGPAEPVSSTSDVRLVEQDSGTSDVKWVDLVDSPDASGIEVVDDSGVRIDAPSDQDLTREAKKEGKKTHTEGKKTQTPDVKASGEPTTAAQPAAPPTKLAPKVAQSTQLAAQSAPQTQLAPPGAADEMAKTAAQQKPDSSKQTHMGAKTAPPTKLAAKSAQPTMLAPPDEEVLDAVPDEAAAPQAKSRTSKTPAAGADDAESVDLGGPAPPTPAPKGKTRSKGAAPQTEPMELLGEELLVEGSSEVNVAGHSERPSGLDLIAEQVESGVDLDDGASKAGTGHKAAAHAEDDSSTVNLAGPIRNPFVADEEATAKTGAGEVEEEVGIVDDEESVVSDVKEPDEELEPVGAGPTKTPRPQTGKYWLGGIAVGVLLTAALGAGAWFAGLLPGSGSKASAPPGPKNDPALAQLRQAKDKAEQDLAAAQADVKKQTDAAAEARKQLNAAKEDARKQVNAATTEAKNHKTAKEMAEGLLKAEKNKSKNLGTQLTEEKTKVTKLTKDLDAADKNARELKTANDKLVKDKAGLLKLVGEVRKRLQAGKYVAANADSEALLLAGLDKALKQAVSPLVTAMGRLAGSLGGAGGDLASSLGNLFELGTWTAGRETQLAYYRGREPLVHSPQKMLNRWINLLNNRDRQDAAEVAKNAERDAKFVINQDVQASPATKAKAHFVMALAQRNLLNYAQAKEDLDKALAGPEEPADAAWRAEARKVLADLFNALPYHPDLVDAPSHRRYAALKASGQLGRVLAEIAAAVKAAGGKEKGSLLAVSSLVHLDQAIQAAQAKGKKLDPKDPGVAQAKKDAADAIAAGAAAEGNYALGRIAEEVGNLDAAETHLKEAEKYQGNKALADLFGDAMDRVLRLKLRGNKPAAEEKKENSKPAKKTQTPDQRRAIRFAALVKRLPSAQGKAAISEAAMLFLLNMTLVNADDGDNPQDQDIDPAIKTAIERANRRIAEGHASGYLLKGEALMKKGDFNGGVKAYVTGLQMLNPNNGDIKYLGELIERHPAFHTPDSAKPPQPLLAEKHFALGLDYFWARRYVNSDARNAGGNRRPITEVVSPAQYAKAEAEFLEAIHYFGKDARYYYYLGLARLLQNQPGKAAEAYENFRQGKRLEDKGDPDTIDVDASLEKVQGKPRQILSRFRQP